ncbi:MAG: response regulator [Nitrospira sp.]|nr:response regulator [Nitrospira sp.]MBS0176911.1 response regulator [Nitrospira sp.]MBX3337482.1 response regulator [Nitrospira sp.]MCW5780974.1 response regulator [Nitrospira sp.]
MGSTIFVIDSSPAVHRMVEQLSMPDGHTVRGFHDGPSALEAARAQSPALIIADYHLEKITFSGFCKEIGRQDNLAETLIISMVDAADRLDESKLRSLGVRAFLKKPFQREQLLETINTILTGTTGRPTAKPAKARTWPPVSTGTDDEDEQELPLDTAADEPPRHEREKEQATMSPLPTQPVLASTSSSSRSKGEELMKDLVDHLLHSTTVQADKTITTLLPGAIAKEVAGQLGTALSKAVQAEVHKQVADAIAPERLQLSLRAMIQEELKRHTEAQLASVEATTRQAVTDIAPALVEQAADIRLGELTDSGIQKHLPHALQAHLDMITQLIKKEVEHVAANYARQAAEEIVREMAKDPILQAVQRIVPDVAETQIRAEITRLSSPD